MTVKHGNPYSQSPFSGKDPDFWQQIMNNTHRAQRSAPCPKQFIPKLQTLSLNPYAILGVNQGASLATIKKAYRRLVKQTHPDVGGDAEQFLQIQQAYEQLMQVY